MSTVRTPWQVTVSVGRALLLREMSTRLTGARAAWLWLLLEPIAHVVFLVLLFSALRSRLVEGADFPLFLALGVLGYFVFRNTMQRAMEAISANAALFAYRQIKPVDTVAVRTLVEGTLQLATTLILFLGLVLSGKPFEVGDPLGVLAAFAGLWCLGAGLGLILAVANVLVPEITRVVRMLLTPLYFASGIMYSPHVLPPRAQQWLLYNPIVHGLESMRTAFFPGYESLPDVSLGYLYGTAALAALLGLALQVRYERRLVAL